MFSKRIVFLTSQVAAAFAADLYGSCYNRTQSALNVLAGQNYPVTGTTNGTIVILPISLELARSIIPAEYPILTEQYKAWLPDWPDDQYPVMLQSEWQHDLWISGVPYPERDFARASLFFPFVDRLNNGHAGMMYVYQLLMGTDSSWDHEAIKVYNINVTSADFDPPCDPYKFTPTAFSNETISMTANVSNSSELGIAWQMTPLDSADTNPYSLPFWYNVSNQIQFGPPAINSSGDYSLCDSLTRWFNTSLSQGDYAPVPVKGAVQIGKTAFVEEYEWKDVYGLKVDQAFWETRGSPCRDFGNFSLVDAMQVSGDKGYGSGGIWLG